MLLLFILCYNAYIAKVEESSLSNINAFWNLWTKQGKNRKFLITYRLIMSVPQEGKTYLIFLPLILVFFINLLIQPYRYNMTLIFWFKISGLPVRICYLQLKNWKNRLDLVPTTFLPVLSLHGERIWASMA